MLVGAVVPAAILLGLRPIQFCITLSYMATLTIRLDKSLERLLARVSRQSGRNRSDVVRDALRRQLAIQSFEELRRRAAPFAEAAGYLTDEDVFREIS